MKSRWTTLLKVITQSKTKLLKLSYYARGTPNSLLRKNVLQICSKFSREQLCRSVISINLQCIFVEITRLHACFHVNLPHIWRALLYQNTCSGMLLKLKHYEPGTQKNYHHVIFLCFTHIFHQSTIKKVE